MKTLHLHLTKSCIPQDGEILKVCKHLIFFRDNLLFAGKSGLASWGYKAVCNKTEELSEGDIVKLYPDGLCKVLWSKDSIHNMLFTTPACNVKCLMCPQPPCADDEQVHKDNQKILSLIDYDPKVICISGGEPFLFPERVKSYFEIINRRWPSCQVDVLTNATRLSEFAMCKEIALSAPINTTFCVSLHSDVASVQQQINGIGTSFRDSVRGINNLGKLRQMVEIRPVITKANYEFLYDFAVFVARNFPYVNHVAFMGQEIVGHARSNYAKIWVDPVDYIAELEQAVEYLDQMRICVSIYNIPLCLLPENLHRFAARSISDWKQGYTPVCSSCVLHDECCGVFLTSGEHLSRGIAPVTKRNNTPDT